MEKTREERLEEYKNISITYFNMFSGRDGEIILEDLKRECSYNRSTFNKDVEKDIYINEGMRNALLYILHKISEGKKLSS